MDALRTGVSMLGLDRAGRHYPARAIGAARAGRAAARPGAGDPRRLDATSTAGRPVAALARRPASPRPCSSGSPAAAHPPATWRSSAPRSCSTPSTSSTPRRSRPARSPRPAPTCTPAITAAIGALKGPLHGGANEKVLEVLATIGSADRAEAWVHEQFAAKRVVMGFGHRVYKDGDVRAKLLGSDVPRDGPWHAEARRLEELADRVERIMLDSKRLKPNLDWPAARVYHALGPAGEGVHADLRGGPDERLDGPRDRADRRQPADPAALDLQRRGPATTCPSRVIGRRSAAGSSVLHGHARQP